jgi:dTDP-4-dehydrorhamnose reductase
MTTVLVLGADGMLGSMICRVLSAKDGFRVFRCTRKGTSSDLTFDARTDPVEALLAERPADWVVNAVGVLDRDIDEVDPDSVATAIDVNAAFPHRLAAAAGRERRVIHFSTDGVFSGRDAPYDENAVPDALGVYGRSKALGEPLSHNCISLRCSIVGPENRPAKSLLGKLLMEPPQAVVTGYTNHRWNGVTTLHLARLCAALIDDDDDRLPPVLHVVPGDAVSKAELITLCLLAFGREDMTVESEASPLSVNRTLRTLHPTINRRLWAAAGYTEPPTVAEMVRELASFGQGEKLSDVAPLLRS